MLTRFDLNKDKEPIAIRRKFHTFEHFLCDVKKKKTIIRAIKRITLVGQPSGTLKAQTNEPHNENKKQNKKYKLSHSR